MAFIMIEGFEHVNPSVNMTAEQFEYLHLGVTPDKVTSWFADAGSFVGHSTGGRVDDNCLKFVRPAGTGTWKDKFGANLGFSFSPKQKVVVGVAHKLSILPTIAIPLIAMRYDNGTTEEEQLSLWASPNGRLFVSVTPFDADYVSQGAAEMNVLAVTPASSIRLTQWSYIELSVNYSEDVPTVSILVNGAVVLSVVASDTFLRTEDPYISSVHLLNACNSHFENAAVTQYFDDMYVDDSTIRGPQRIIPISHGTSGGSIVSNLPSGHGWSGVPSPVYAPANAGVIADQSGSTIVWNLDNIPTGVGTINLVGVHLVGVIELGLDGVKYGFKAPSSGTPRVKADSLAEGTPDRLVRMISTSLPGGLPMNETGVNAVLGYLSSDFMFT